MRTVTAHISAYANSMSIPQSTQLCISFFFCICSTDTSTDEQPLPFSCFLLSSRGGTCTSCNTRGRRVTMPDPRGKKSRPTRLSSTELFPLLCGAHGRQASVRLSATDTHQSGYNKNLSVLMLFGYMELHVKIKQHSVRPESFFFYF